MAHFIYIFFSLLDLHKIFLKKLFKPPCDLCLSIKTIDVSPEFSVTKIKIPL